MLWNIEAVDLIQHPLEQSVGHTVDIPARWSWRISFR
jgi:hypothetical protein